MGDPQAEPHARYGVARVLSERGRHEEALAELDRAVGLYPEFGAAWYARGLALRKLGRLDEARESLGRAARFGTRWPGVPDPVLAEVRGLRDDGQARLARGSRSSATATSRERCGNMKPPWPRTPTWPRPT